MVEFHGHDPLFMSDEHLSNETIKLEYHNNSISDGGFHVLFLSITSIAALTSPWPCDDASPSRCEPDSQLIPHDFAIFNGSFYPIALTLHIN